MSVLPTRTLMPDPLPGPTTEDMVTPNTGLGGLVSGGGGSLGGGGTSAGFSILMGLGGGGGAITATSMRRKVRLGALRAAAPKPSMSATCPTNESSNVPRKIQTSSRRMVPPQGTPGCGTVGATGSMFNANL